MDEIEAKAERVRQIVEGNFGKVLSRDGDVMTVGIAADASIGLNALWGMSGFVPIFKTSTTRLAPVRVTDNNGNVVAYPDHQVTTSFYVYSIDLAPRGEEPTRARLPGEITQPTKPHGA